MKICPLYRRLTAGVMLSLFAIVGAADQPASVDVSTVGPKIGEHVPPFSLRDQTGKEWTLDSIMGPKGAMLVFFRSADW